MSGGELKVQGNFEYPPWGISGTQTTFTYMPRKLEVKILNDNLVNDNENDIAAVKISEYLNNGWIIVHQSSCAQYGCIILITVLQRYSDWNAPFHCPYDPTIFKNHEAK